jgi:uncharacterized protein
MNARRLDGAAGTRTFVLVFSTGERVIEPLLAFARSHEIAAASLTGIGAFERATLGYFDMQKRDYTRIPIDEQVEVVSLVGNIARGDEGPKLHAHLVVAKQDGTAHGGHLLDGVVRPTLEVMLVETPAHLRRRMDPATGLALIDLAST